LDVTGGNLKAILLAAGLFACAYSSVSPAQWADGSLHQPDAQPARSLAEIQQAFDRSKMAFFKAFVRQADKHGLGPGKIVVSITISPDGTVKDCHVVSSTYGEKAVNEAIVAEVKKLNFGARDVPEFTYPDYPINFLPA